MCISCVAFPHLAVRSSTIKCGAGMRPLGLQTFLACVHLVSKYPVERNTQETSGPGGSSERRGPIRPSPRSAPGLSPAHGDQTPLVQRCRCGRPPALTFGLEPPSCSPSPSSLCSHLMLGVWALPPLLPTRPTGAGSHGNVQRRMANSRSNVDQPQKSHGVPEAGRGRSRGVLA